MDPDATGVLPVCLGKATKLCDMLTDKDKTYEAVLLLGKSTDTQDISGTVLEEHGTGQLTEQEVTNCIQSYIGEYQQMPPMYSALKVNGKKLYELAREGKEVERKTRSVQIMDIQILKMELPRVWMSVTCSKGTYIRTLCHDIGHALGVCGCMEGLVRTRVSLFSLDQSLTLEQIEKRRNDGGLNDIVIPIDAMFAEYPKVVLNSRGKYLVYNGNVFTCQDIAENECFSETCQPDVNQNIRVYDDEGNFAAIYQFYALEKKFKIVKMFLDPEIGRNYAQRN